MTTETAANISALVHDETAFLRDQLATCSRLLKCSLKANRPFDSQMRTKVSALLERLESGLDSKDRYQAQERAVVARVTQQVEELQGLIVKHEEMTRLLRAQVKQLEAENGQIRSNFADYKTQLAELQAQIEKMRVESAKITEERDLAKEQSKKLVELLQRMERKSSEKAEREEALEEENLNLREVTKLMSGQIEKIERELESKLVRKDQTIIELQQRLESQQKVQKYNLDLEQDLEDLQAIESQFK